MKLNTSVAASAALGIAGLGLLFYFAGGLPAIRESRKGLTGSAQ